jgi:HK97 family phage portal protein
MAGWLSQIRQKAADMFYPRALGSFSSFMLGFPRTSYNYAADVGDGLASSVVQPVINWITRSFPEAPLIVQKRVKDEWETVRDHPLTKLLEQPNPFYSGPSLWMNTLADWCWYGEAYWRIIPSRGGQPGELWWLPPWSIQPVWPPGGEVFISHYEYGPDLHSMIRLEVEEVVHFRHGLDPRNLRHGLPPLRAILQDIWVDQESANFIGAVLRNMGVPGIILSPKDKDGRLNQAEVDRVKDYITARFTGDQRGLPLALGAPTDVQKLSFAPADLGVTDIRNTAEERVSAAMGIPAAVVGFGTGLETTKVGATMGEMRKLAWQNGIIPVQRIMGAELSRTLLPWYESDAEDYRTAWDYDEVVALQEDQNDLAKRYQVLFDSSILMRSECREALGYDSTPEDEVYKKPLGVDFIGPGAPEPEPAPQPALPPAAGNVPPPGSNGQPGAVAVQERAFLKQGSVEELVQGIIGRHVRRISTVPTAAKRLADRLWKQDQAVQPQLQAMLMPVFEKYGRMARVAAQEILFPQKQDLTHLFSAGVIMDRTPIMSIKADLADVFEQIYDLMAKMTIQTIQAALGEELTDPARVEAQVRMLARERVGLLDLTEEARTAILKTLEEAQTAGLDEEAMLRLLEERVPAGRSQSSDMRARVIARTESRLASNLSTASYARQAGVNLLVFDARLGPTDQPCMDRNGWIVSPAQAQALSAVEHVNGTLGFAPISDAMVQAGGATTT